jgi:hypothetical protein
MTDENSDELVKAYIASKEMDNAARYLQAGRRFAGLSAAELRTAWVKFWRGYYEHDRDDLWLYGIDANAELTLRGLQRPVHLFAARTRKRIDARRRENARRPEVARRLREGFEDFVRQCAARRH